MSGQVNKGSKSVKFTVASNDINRPSVPMLMTLFVPLLFACSLAFYLLTMPLDAGSVVSPSTIVVVDRRSTVDGGGTEVFGGTSVVPGTSLRVEGRGDGTGVYFVYLPVVFRDGGSVFPLSPPP